MVERPVPTAVEQAQQRQLPKGRLRRGFGSGVSLSTRTLVRLSISTPGRLDKMPVTIAVVN